MFLQEIREVGVPDLDMIYSKRLNKRCAYRLKLRQDLRNRFRNEYIGTQKDYSKVKEESSIKEGDLLLIDDANNKRINWLLEKVTKTYKGKDGKVRVMEGKTQFGSVMRPIQKLYSLEVTTVDSLPSTERDVEDGPCLDKVPISVVQRVRHSRYGRLFQ
ncbi:integrase catalytic domain-containing protein [Trichonephila clavipes]|nr:integrase catalytic domain-containing protein [Trichonephila clavipes]